MMTATTPTTQLLAHLDTVADGVLTHNHHTGQIAAQSRHTVTPDEQIVATRDDIWNQLGDGATIDQVATDLTERWDDLTL